MGPCMHADMRADMRACGGGQELLCSLEPKLVSLRIYSGGHHKIENFGAGDLGLIYPKALAV